ncbi:hypothetical protein [uncultured Bacteroides sp.]|uniref:hypothetical protein n=1 Tax=uncultured Bacteroides sp. TaxID=162156 RepID=UPI002AABA5F6|nr:hypothetical protein [uncultured Bacteroides sp.]
MRTLFLLLFMMLAMGTVSAQKVKATATKKTEQTTKKTEQTTKAAEPTSTNGTKKCFVDANKNGVCDKYEKKTCKSGNGTGAEDCRGNIQNRQKKASTPRS